MKWTEGEIIRAISRQTLNSKCLLLVDRCLWTGHECDVLAVTNSLRVIDIEVKISRADLKADAKKEKWWHYLTYEESQAAGLDHRLRLWDPQQARQRVEWPRKVWKHYYAMPADIWKPELADSLGSDASGILLLSRAEPPNVPVVVRCLRRAYPNPNAAPLSARSAIDIARLANLRMWEAYARFETMEREKACPSTS